MIGAMTSDLTMDGNTTVPSQNMTLTELNDKMALALLPAMIFVGILMIVGVVGNGIVCYVFARKMPKGTQNFLVICLAVFDILNCTVAMPTEIVDMRQSFTFESETACKVLRFMNVFTAISSIFTLLAIAVDRYKNVLHPFQRQMSLRTAQRALILIIIGALLFSWPALILYGIYHVEVGIPGLYGRDCSTRDAARDTVYPLIYNIVQFMGFALITVVLVVIYVRILRETRRHYKYLKDTSDFYYVSGAVARSDNNPKISLISDSRLNLHDYFVKEVNMHQCFGFRVEGIDNPGLDLQDGEDSKSTSSKEQRFNKAKSPGRIDHHTPVLLRRFQGGRTNAKYFISRHSDDVITTNVQLEEVACKKSSSTPNFANIIVKRDAYSRDIQSEGKPTPQSNRRFVKRQTSTNSLGKRSLNLVRLSGDAKAVYKNVCYSDGDVRQVANLSYQDSILVEKRPRHTKDGIAGNKKGSSPTKQKRSPRSSSFLQVKHSQSACSVNDSFKSEHIDAKSSVSLTEKDNDLGSSKHTTPMHNSNSSDTQSSEHKANDSVLQCKGKTGALGSDCHESQECCSVQRHGKNSGKDSGAHQSQGCDAGQSDVLDSNVEQDHKSYIVLNTMVEEDPPVGAAAEFFVPQYDEGIDMTFEVEDENFRDGTLALCPQCQSQYYINENESNGGIATGSRNDVSNVIIAEVICHTDFDGVSTSSAIGKCNSADILKQEGSLDESSRHSCDPPNTTPDEESVSQSCLGQANKYPQPVLLKFDLCGELESCDAASILSERSLAETGGNYDATITNSSCKHSLTKSNLESNTATVLINTDCRSDVDFCTLRENHNCAPISSTDNTQSTSKSEATLSNSLCHELSPRLLHQTSQLSNSNGSECPDQAHNMTDKTDHAHKPSSATSIAFSVTTVFILSFLPHLSLMLARVLKPNFDNELSGSYLVLYNIFLRSYLINSSLNSFVYGFLNQQFRHECYHILRTNCLCRD